MRLSTLAARLAVFLSACSLHADVCLRSNPSLADIGLNPKASAAADLDGDGWIDLAVIDGSVGSAYILLNDGAGRFFLASTLSLPAAGFGIAAADFDSDGRTDLAVTVNFPINQVAVVRNLGQAVFSAPTVYSTWAYPGAVDAADLNGDGAPDLAVACGDYPGRMSVLLNSGDGTFAAATNLTTGGDRAADIKLVDIDGDGDRDALVTNEQSASLARFLNDGTGHFAPAWTLGTPQYPHAVSVAELLDPPGIDLVLSCGNWGTTSGQLAIFTGAGGGAFSSGPILPLPASALLAAVTDLDGDGDLDLLGGYNGYFAGFYFGMSVWLQDAGVFVAGADLLVPESPAALLALDVDQDGDADAVVVCDQAQTVATFLNPGDGAFQQPEILANLDSRFHTADVTQDGRSDMIWPNSGVAATTRGVRISRDIGDGTFGPSTYYETLRFADGIHPADLDGDGDLDLVVQCEGFYNDITLITKESGITLLENLGDGTFTRRADLLTGTNHWTRTAAVADFSGDGLPDIVANLVTTVSMMKYVENLGNWNFAAAVDAGVQDSAQLYAADLDGDSAAELIAVASFPDEQLLGVYSATQGQFTLATTIDTGHISREVIFVDANHDGLPEVIQVGGNYIVDLHLTVIPNLGGLTFGSPVDLTINQLAARLLAADLDGDGNVDLATANGSRGDISVYEGAAKGEFSEPISYAVGDAPLALAQIDRGADGRPELYVGLDATRALILEPCIFACGGDANADGKIDLSDLGLVLSHYGVGHGALREEGDMDRDGDVDLSDLGIVLAAFGGACP